MKWGSKKSASPGSGSVINRVFPVSWFSRFRQKGSISETKSARNKHHNFPTPNASLPKRRFYSMDEDDAYWRMSFSQERSIQQQGRRSTGGINPLWYDDSDREFEFPVSRFQALDLGEIDGARREEECQKFNDMVSDIKKMKEKQKKSTQDGALIRRNGDSQLMNPRANDLNGQTSRLFRQKAGSERGFDDGKVRVSNLGESDLFPTELDDVQKQGHVWKNSRKQAQTHDFHLNIRVKTECPNRPAESYSRKTKNKSRAKAYSPRSECKIRALEDMKKVRMKSKKKGGKGQVTTVFDSFAVVKSSYDPQRDFRDSMVEMIREKGIRRSEDLEELLACYLTMNHDEYHDLIIKVFRQVWYEISSKTDFDY